MIINNFGSVKVYSRFFTKSVKPKYSFEIPEKYKDTFIGKWATFWKNLYLDYKEVVVETASKARDKPRNAILTLTGVAGLLYCFKLNPDEQSFRDAVLECSQELALVGAPIRNPSTLRHLDRVGKCFDGGEVRRLSLGVASLVWADNRDVGLGIYSAQCPYLRPHPADWPGQLLDVGFVGQWWVLRRAMRDYDINRSEFEDPTDT